MLKIAYQSDWTNLHQTVLLPIQTKTLETQEFAEFCKKQLNFSIDRLKVDFKGEKNEVHLIHSSDYRIFLLGLGEIENSLQIVKILRRFSSKYHQKFSTALALDCSFFSSLSLIEYCINGLLLGVYEIGKFKSEKKESSVHPFTQQEATLTIVSPMAAVAVEQVVQKGIATAETQMSIMDIVNAPSNKKTPQVLAIWALQSAEKHGFKATVWGKAEIEAAGMGAILAVNRGSEHDPHFIILEYVGQSPVAKVGLVGKGITFDTGGLSIKPSEGMYYMKSDMGGAGAVLGTIELVAKLKLPIHLMAVVPATDNLVDALSFRPSDVIPSHSGKTIEIVDTDAEGRLVLADALSYIVKEFQPEVLIDLATLTGSTVRTLGYHAAALFTNNNALHDALTLAGEKTGEKVWRLPLWQEYEEDLKSDVADLKNFSGKPTAGAISAAKFLEVFTDEHPNWAHLDIAGVAFSDTEFSSQKSATAYGIRLLVNYIENLCQN